MSSATNDVVRQPPAGAPSERARQVFEFPPFALDLASGVLTREGSEVLLRPKTFAVLAALVQRHGTLVSQESLMAAGWRGASGSAQALKNCIRELRGVLGDSARAPRFIRTTHGRGYRFIADVAAPAGAATSAAAQASVALVEREEPLAALESNLEKALGGARQLVFVNGEAGVGKSALVDTFIERYCVLPGVIAGRGQCIDQRGTGEAWLPVVDALLDACQRADFDALELLRTRAPAWYRRLPQATERERHNPPGEGSLLLHLDEALAAVAATHPLVLVFEDLQWADGATLELLSMFARRRSAAGVLIIATYRLEGVVGANHPLPGMKQELIVHRKCAEIALQPLSAAGIETFLEQHYMPRQGEPEQWRAFAHRLHARTSGNALFMTEQLKHLVERGCLHRDGGQWVLEQMVDCVLQEMPADLQLFIDEQINRLEASEREVLETASLVGPQFSARLIMDLIDVPRATIEGTCAKLAKRRTMLAFKEVKMLEDGDSVQIFRFLHDLHRESLASRVPPAARTRALRAIAERVEKLYADDTSPVYGELADLFEQCRQYHRAVHYYLLNARQLQRNGAGREARAALARAGELFNFVRDPTLSAELEAQLAVARKEFYDPQSA